MSLYSSAVKKPVTTVLVFVAVVIIGLFSLLKLPIDLYPDIDTNTIMVMTTYSGASSQDIEQNVTRPLENSLNSVEHLKHITSNSKENISIITLEFEYGYDIDVLTNNVRDKLDMVSNYLPDNAETPIIFKFSTDMIPIVLISAEAEESLPGLYKILDESVANPLARVDGVGTVSVTGAPKREIHIYLDPARLEAYNLSVESVNQLIANENRNVPGGTFDIGSDTYSIRVQGEFKDPQEMRNLVVGSKDGAVVRLSDVARIDDSLEERAQETYTNGKKGAMIVVQKQSGANSVDISNKIKKALPGIQKNLPSDVKLDYIVDTSDNIRNTIASLEETVMYALIFVVLVVFVFLGRWRATIIIAITIPISLIASFIYLFATGNTLNIVSLSALSISIGMVVDDAIVVLENVTTHIERGADPKQAAVHGTNEVAISVVASIHWLGIVLWLVFLIGILILSRLSWVTITVAGIGNAFVSLVMPVLWMGLKDYQQNRILTFLDPTRDPLGAGCQIIQSKIAIGNGSIFGKGWLGGTQKNMNFLPEHHTDFIFSTIGEEFGFFGSIILLGVFAFFFARMIRAASELKVLERKVATSGIFAYLISQSFINIGMNIGLVPATGIPLPFISYGGSNLLFNTLSVAVVLKYMNERGFMK